MENIQKNDCKKPIGILTGTGGMADEIQGIIAKGNRGAGKIVYDDDPKKLLEKLIKLIDKEKDVEKEFAPGKGGGEQKFYETVRPRRTLNFVAQSKIWTKLVKGGGKNGRRKINRQNRALLQ